MLNEIKFSKDQTDRIVYKIKKHFNEALEQEIGSFDAEFLIEFFAKEIGAHYYNQGIIDAQSLFSEKAEEITYLLQDLEKPVD